MVLQSSGAISLGDIGTEFNDTTPTSISEFYNPPAQVGGTIPVSGEISFSDFYSATNSWTTSFTTSRTTSNTTSKTTSRTTSFTTSFTTSYTTSFTTSNTTNWR